MALAVGGETTLYTEWKPRYKLGFGALWACGTDDAAREFFATSEYFRGFMGVGVPYGYHQFGATVAEIIPPGAQGMNT